MKIVHLDRVAKRFVRVRWIKKLLPFEEKSFAEQMYPVLQGSMFLIDDLFLVFTHREEAAILKMLGLAMGGMRRDQGMGHGTSGEMCLLGFILSEVQYKATYIPTDGNADVTPAEVTKWSLAITSV